MFGFDTDSVADLVVADVAAKHGGLSIRDVLQAAYIEAVSEALDARRKGNRVMSDAWKHTAIEIGVRRNLHEMVIS